MLVTYLKIHYRQKFIYRITLSRNACMSATPLLPAYQWFLAIRDYFLCSSRSSSFNRLSERGDQERNRVCKVLVDFSSFGSGLFYSSITSNY